MELIDGHVYRDGKEVYQATKAVSAAFTLALFRVNIYKGALVDPIVAGSIIGYLQKQGGEWHVLRVGHPKYTNSAKVLRPYPYFVIDVLPNLKHVADSFEEYIKQYPRED
jgi:hypothetical protein